jgi:hypothetical protein
LPLVKVGPDTASTESSLVKVGPDTQSLVKVGPDEGPAPPPRVSNPFRQAAAGFTDIGTGLLQAAGLVGSAFEGGINTIGSDKSFSENFNIARSEGFDKTLTDTGIAGREAVNKFLDIKDPVSTEDQAARILGGFLVPVPAGFLGGAAATGLKGVLGKATTLIAPTVRTGKGFGLRAGVSVGVGGGIDQGIRAFEDRPDKPLIFSDTALSGRPAPEQTLQKVEQTLQKVTEEQLTQEQENDAKFQRSESYENLKTVLFIIAGGLGSFAAVRALRGRAAAKLEANAPVGTSAADKTELGEIVRVVKDDPHQAVGFLKGKAQESSDHLHENYVDKTEAIVNDLRAKGVPEEDIAEQVFNLRQDAAGRNEHLLETGMFPEDSGLVTHSMREMDNQFAALTPEHQSLFDRAMLATNELNRLRNDDLAKPSLWRKGINQDELGRVSDLGRNTPEVRALMDKMNDFFDKHLLFGKHGGLIDQRGIDSMRFLSSNVDGTNGFHPFFDAKGKNIYQDLAKFFGIHTNAGKQADIVGVYKSRGATTNKIDPVTGESVAPKPLGIMASARRFSELNMRAVLNEGARAKALESMTNTRLTALDGVAGGTKLTRVRIDPATGRELPQEIGENGKALLPETSRDARLIGTGTIDDSTESVLIKVVGDDPKVRALFDKGGRGRYSQEDLKAFAPDEVVIVQQQGQLRAYHVPDPIQRAMLDIDHQLSAPLLFLNHYKRLATRLTVGDLSLFAPLSHAFSSQQIAWNTFTRQGFVEGIKVIPEGLRGTWQLLKANSSKEISNYLSQRIATNTGIAQVAPKQSAALQQRLHDIFERSLSNDIRHTGGRMRTGAASETFRGDMADFQNTFGDGFSKVFGADEMGLAWKLWKGWNNAIQEGPAFAVASKHMGRSLIENGGAPLTVRQKQAAIEASQLVAGDMHRQGASKAAEFFNATSPFSASMVQSWNTLGAAAKHNWGRFIMGAGTLVGIPTISEMAYTSVLSETMGEDGKPMMFKFPGDPTDKMWTYNDYYWNGYTTQQRADNFIMMVPGKPPWEAILYPVSPEWGMFRGAVMESVDAIFQFSNEGFLNKANNGTEAYSRNQLRAGLVRGLDIPMNPLFVASFSALGIDMRVGANVVPKEGEDPGEALSFARFQPFGAGQRLTRRTETKFVNDSINTRVANVIGDIFGAAGQLYIGVHEAFSSGLDVGEDPGIVQAVTNATDAFGSGLKRQARYFQPLWGRSLNPNNSGEIESGVFQARANLKLVIRDVNNLLGGGVVSGTTGAPNISNTILTPGDGIYGRVAEASKVLDGHLKQLDFSISEHRRQRALDRNATNRGSRQDIQDSMDTHTLTIQRLMAQQGSVISKFEKDMTKTLSTMLKRDVPINLRTIKPRPNPSGPASR